jgi:hypothetical protein
MMVRTPVLSSTRRNRTVLTGTSGNGQKITRDGIWLYLYRFLPKTVPTVRYGTISMTLDPRLGFAIIREKTLSNVGPGISAPRKLPENRGTLKPPGVPIIKGKNPLQC